MLVQSIRLVDLIVNRGIPLSEFAIMASLMVPRFVAFILPVSLFGATVFVYHRMIGDNELVILRSAGIGQFGLAKPAILVSVATVFITLSMTSYFMPTASQEFRERLDKNRSQWGAALLHEGKFTSIGDSVTMFVRKRNGSELFGILYHSSEDENAPYTVMAQRGSVIDTEQGPRIVVLDGNRQTFEDGKIHFLSFERSVLDIGVKSEEVGIHWPQPEERYLPNLLQPGDTPNDQKYHNNLIEEGNSRIAMIFLPVSYIGIALIFMLRAGFSRRGNTWPILGSVAVMTAILAGHLSLANLSSKNLDFLPLLYANAILPAIIGIALVFRDPVSKSRSAVPTAN